ncbi:SPOR domain-containing protein [Parasphingorhabdus sp. JC815]|uniref:SPOR domain-containing protein n=1 Tax=Parasphingorhabdus sp. JC815 TaxID=3232140 RepID=UPI00345A4ADC
MKRDMILKLAASTMVISATMTGCSSLGSSSTTSASSAPVSPKHAARYAAKAERALEKGNVENAIAYAERSVAAVGNDPNTRALLGQTYLAAGRFHSAERSFLDSMDLGRHDARTILSLSLAQLAQGKANKAKQLVENNRQYIPTADYGLALALAGDSEAAIAVLEQAIRASDVSGRTRQNLGLAYALDGRWREAKLLASQDMAPANVDKRIMQWAQMARPGAYEMRVASILNVKPAIHDPGQPVRLALNVAPVMPAAAALTPAEDYSREIANFDSDPAPSIADYESGMESKKAFLTEEKNTLVTKVTVPANGSAAMQEDINIPNKKAAPAKAVIKNIAYAPQKTLISNGEYLVQVGAYSSPENVKRAWSILSSKHKSLAAFQHTSTTISLNGKTLYRLSAVGFANQQSARDLCQGIKANGDGCFVRKYSKTQPKRIDDRAPTEFASR